MIPEMADDSNFVANRAQKRTRNRDAQRAFRDRKKTKLDSIGSEVEEIKSKVNKLVEIIEKLSANHEDMNTQIKKLSDVVENGTRNSQNMVKSGGIYGLHRIQTPVYKPPKSHFPGQIDNSSIHSSSPASSSPLTPISMTGLRLTQKWQR